jgi:hypothetical protein
MGTTQNTISRVDFSGNRKQKRRTVQIRASVGHPHQSTQRQFHKAEKYQKNRRSQENLKPEIYNRIP